VRSFVSSCDLFRETGKGLGMIIMKRLIELLGGTLALLSEPNKGSSFTLTFEMRQQLPSQESKSSAERSGFLFASAFFFLLTMKVYFLSS